MNFKIFLGCVLIIISTITLIIAAFIPVIIPFDGRGPTTTTTTTVPIIAFPKTEKDIILEIVKNATEGKRWVMHEVGYDRYNCADFTADSVLALRERNYTAYPVCGWLNHGYHAWIGVEINETIYHIEPQDGVLIYPSTADDYDPSNPYFFGRRCIVRGVV